MAGIHSSWYVSQGSITSFEYLLMIHMNDLFTLLIKKRCRMSSRPKMRTSETWKQESVPHKSGIC